MSRIAAILPARYGNAQWARNSQAVLELDGTPIVILSLRRIAAAARLQTYCGDAGG